MRKATLFTIINLILSGILWLLGILTLLFNILGLWTFWQLCGFGFLFFIPVPAISELLALFYCNREEKKLLTVNLIAFAVSLGLVLLTVGISTSWFW